MTFGAFSLFQHISCFINGATLFMSVYSLALPADSNRSRCLLGAEHCQNADLYILAVPLRHSWCPAGILVMIVLLCLTPVFKNMPQNAQAAVIIAAVIGLFRYDEWWFLWKVAFLALAILMCVEPGHILTRAGLVHLENVAGQC